MRLFFLLQIVVGLLFAGDKDADNTALSPYEYSEYMDTFVQNLPKLMQKYDKYEMEELLTKANKKLPCTDYDCEQISVSEFEGDTFFVFTPNGDKGGLKTYLFGKSPLRQIEKFDGQVTPLEKDIWLVTKSSPNVCELGLPTGSGIYIQNSATHRELMQDDPSKFFEHTPQDGPWIISLYTKDGVANSSMHSYPFQPSVLDWLSKHEKKITTDAYNKSVYHFAIFGLSSYKDGQEQGEMVLFSLSCNKQRCTLKKVDSITWIQNERETCD